MSTRDWEIQVLIPETKIFKVGDVKYTANGKPVMTITTSKYQGKNADGSYKDSLFLDLQIWGEDMVEYARQLQPKHKIKAQGYLKQNSWVDKATGQKRTKIFLEATAIEYIADSRAQ